jgi:phage terminase large subunit-like protein
MNGQDLIDFAEKYITRNEENKAWILSAYQRAVILIMFVKLYSIRLWSEPKKSGKTFLAALVALFYAMTRPDSEVVLLANDEDQSLGRVFATCAKLIEYNQELRASARTLASEIRFTNGSTIKAQASDYKGAAGGRQILTVFDELWAYDSERALRLFEEMTPPPTIPDAFIFIVSYAGFTGESTVLEKLYDRGHKGKRLSRQYEITADAGLCMFWSHTARQSWQTKDYYAEQRRILRENTFRRLHRNEWVSAESQFISAEQWDACVDRNLSPALNGKSVFLGVDLGVKSDSSAVVAVGWDPTGKKLITAFHKIWRPSRGSPVNLDEVKQYIEEICRLHSVRGILADPSQCFLLIQQLAPLGITVTEFPQTQANGVKMGESLFSLVRDGNLIAYKSAELREHVLNATGIETPSGVRMVKGKSTSKIDAAISLAMACVAAVQMPAIDLSGMALIGRQRMFNPRRDWHEQTERRDDYGGSTTIGELFDSGELFRRSRWDW